MLLAGLLLSTSALAYQPSTNKHGNEVSWEVMPVHWAYVDEGRPADVPREEAVHAVREAFAEWNAVLGARVRFIEDDGTTPEFDVNLVYWDDEWAWDPDILALTATWSTRSGELVNFSIGINARDPAWATDGRKDAMDLQNALTHEVGHALGLAHDPQHADATMAPTASEGETRKRDLHRSDEDGARSIYPGDPTALHCATADAPPSLLWTLAISVLAALGTRRRNDAPSTASAPQE